MNRDSFAYGSAIGVAVGLALSVASAGLLKKQPDANLVNFGPAIFGIAIVGLEILAAAGALVIASLFLLRKRWKRAGFALAFGVTVVGWYVKALFY
jgi:hypothetical protein